MNHPTHQITTPTITPITRQAGIAINDSLTGDQYDNAFLTVHLQCTGVRHAQHLPGVVALARLRGFLFRSRRFFEQPHGSLSGGSGGCGAR